jgi:hypothetical protein
MILKSCFVVPSLEEDTQELFEDFADTI